jgi:hypothetical protein
MQYWQQVLAAEKNGSIPPVDIPSLYLAGFNQLSPREKSVIGGTLGQFLRDLGYFDAAAKCFDEEEKANPSYEVRRVNRLS